MDRPRLAYEAFLEVENDERLRFDPEMIQRVGFPGKISTVTELFQQRLKSTLRDTGFVDIQTTLPSEEALVRKNPSHPLRLSLGTGENTFYRDISNVNSYIDPALPPDTYKSICVVECVTAIKQV